ncbi:MAG TPA: hypothetical protein VGF24_35960 [Vicinamibacterales bacterium]
MERHVRLLGILSSLGGKLAMLMGVSMLLLAAGALTALMESRDFAAGMTTVVFAVVGVFALIWGAAHVWAAVLLDRRQPFGRVLTLGLALVNLVVLPFGTAFGIYACWTLLTNEGRRLFEPAR